ncbi:MAG: exodeoxyribonuclease VII large subunit [Lachnospiraceae bacterium]|nr:exodeoxyribonuclease VII large subunit [Lachnospiraceae bacterium]
MNKKIYSVSQINSYIWGMFSQDFYLRDVSIKGEVRDAKYWKDGTIYFTLKDDKSLIPCVCFRDKAAGLKFKLEDGMSVIGQGSVSVYKEGGKYQYYVTSMEKEGQGDLYAKFLKLKEELEEKGLFAEEYKQSIPYLAKRVGIVTAPTGAAVRDIIQISRRRNPYVQLILYPAIVQGKQAPDSIVRGIKAMDAAGVDVIIVGRGGGSMEDLWAFNEEIVAQAIFDCTTPIISAVGHETDTTIADFAADLRAPTPSAAAELAVKQISDILGYIDDCEKRLNYSFKSLLKARRLHAEKLSENLKRLSPEMMLNDKRQRLQAIEEKLYALTDKKIAALKSRAAQAELGIKHLSPESLIADRKQKAQTLRLKMDGSFDRYLQRDKHRLALLIERYKARSPLDRLGGGYVYATGENGRPLTAVSKLKAGDAVRLRFKDGSADARIENIRENGTS